MKKKTTLPKSNAKTAYGLLSDVCRAISEEPLRYTQHDYIARPGIASDSLYDKYPNCGTIGCVAGWAVVLKARQPRRLSWFCVPIRAQKLLGLTVTQADELFDTTALEGLTSAPPQSAEHAAAGVAHIRAFQKRYAKQLKAKAV